jgi:hypothetical protein
MGMDQQKAADELKTIRLLMERPVRYSVASGRSGILAGGLAIVGVLLDWHFSGVFADAPHTAMVVCAAVWGGVFVAALAGVWLLTRARERQRDMPAWSPVKRRILLTILPPFVAGAGLALAIVFRWYRGDGPNEWGLIAPAWMLFYGVACWQVGELAIRELRFMGASFIAAGLVCAAFFQAEIPGLTSVPGTAPYWTMAATFGGFHILYGAIVWAKHGG